MADLGRCGTPRSLVGQVREVTPNGDYVVECPTAPRPFELHYLKAWQARSATVGARVRLEYRSGSSWGGWVVAEVLV